MRILFISDSLLTGDLAYRLKSEGCEVKLYIADDSCSLCYDKLVERVQSWRRELSWVGKDGLIIFDDTGYAEDQESLRKQGYQVFGSSILAEKTEVDRSFGDKIFQESGITTVELKSFSDADSAIQFVTLNPKRWVIKYQNGCWSKPYTYLGEDTLGSDVIAVLENYKRLKINTDEIITLQERIDGVEIGVARYFNGTDWVGPIEYNAEHTHLFPGDKGPIVNEMGTVVWMRDDEEEKLYSSTLEKLKPFLTKAGFRGNIDINCIVNETGVFPLETTARFGSPAIHAQHVLVKSSWKDLLLAVASGTPAEIHWHKDFCVVTSVVTPPFPYRDKDIGKTLVGLPLTIHKSTSPETLKHLHLDEVASSDGTLKNLYISGSNGYAFYTTGLGKTIKDAREMSLSVLDKVYVSRMFYRDDIGKKFEEQNLKKLTSWGYLNGVTSKAGRFRWL